MITLKKSVKYASKVEYKQRDANTHPPAKIFSRTIFFIDFSEEITSFNLSVLGISWFFKTKLATQSPKPETVLYLSNLFYNHHPNASIFGIQGYEWELKIGLSNDKLHINILIT